MTFLKRFYLIFILFLCTIATFYYYLRIIKIIFFDNDTQFVKRKYLNEIRLF